MARNKCKSFQIINFLKSFFRTVNLRDVGVGSLKCFVINIDVIAFYLTTCLCSGSVFIKLHSGFDFCPPECRVGKKKTLFLQLEKKSVIKHFLLDVFFIYTSNAIPFSSFLSKNPLYPSPSPCSPTHPQPHPTQAIYKKF